MGSQKVEITMNTREIQKFIHNSFENSYSNKVEIQKNWIYSSIYLTYKNGAKKYKIFKVI